MRSLKLPNFGKSPQADWKTILIGAAILACGFIAFSIYLFVNVEESVIFINEAQEETPGAPNRSTLKRITDGYDAREREFEAIKENREDIANPS